MENAVSNEPINDRLERHCQRCISASGTLRELSRLSGGANMESWRFVFGDGEYVLRRLPAGIADSSEGATESHIDLAAQADLIDAMGAHGVRVPRVRSRLSADDGLGEGFVMDLVKGETLPQKLLRDPQYAPALASLTGQWAEQLAAIHAVPENALPQSIQYRTPEAMLAELEQRCRDLSGTSPVYALAFGWLEQHLPDPIEPVLCHGDFRMGNLLIDKAGLSAVLDWELAHFGDPAQDLGFGCIPSWRFGNHDRTLGGFGEWQDLLSAYSERSGRAITPERFRFWQIYSTLWWGICCLGMAAMWRRGDDRALERLVIGRRASEVEIDLLLLLEETEGPSGSRLDFSDPEPASETGNPAPGELAEALKQWLGEKILPQAEGHALFEARVANNALGMIERDCARKSAFLDAAQARLAGLGTDEAALASMLRKKGLKAMTVPIWDHLRLIALENCSIDQPGYAGFRKARSLW
ncbi:MAG: phosphotransferase family protein [Blastomonas sp.]